MAGMATVAFAAHATPGLRRLTPLSIAVAVGVTAGAFAFVCTPQSAHGVVERVVYLLTAAWLVLTSLMALRSNRSGSLVKR